MEDDERREAALETKAAVLQPNFKSKCIREDQLNKFKELHRKRLQIKARSSKVHKNSKGNASGAAKPQKDLSRIYSRDEDTNTIATVLEDSSITSLQQDNATTLAETTKRQKLHWGLDTKERWERKANM